MSEVKYLFIETNGLPVGALVTDGSVFLPVGPLATRIVQTPERADLMKAAVKGGDPIEVIEAFLTNSYLQVRGPFSAASSVSVNDVVQTVHRTIAAADRNRERSLTQDREDQA